MRSRVPARSLLPCRCDRPTLDTAVTTSDPYVPPEVFKDKLGRPPPTRPPLRPRLQRRGPQARRSSTAPDSRGRGLVSSRLLAIAEHIVPSSGRPRSGAPRQPCRAQRGAGAAGERSYWCARDRKYDAARLPGLRTPIIVPPQRYCTEIYATTRPVRSSGSTPRRRTHAYDIMRAS
jgi:hypothetical protein